MRNFTDYERAAIARAWPASGLTQAVFAGQHDISERALRSWTRRYACRRPPTERARAIVREAVEQLQGVLASLDADVVEAACHSPPQNPEADAGNAEAASRPAGATQSSQVECAGRDSSALAEPCRLECRSEQTPPLTTVAAARQEAARRPEASGAARHGELDDIAVRAQTELCRLGVTAAALTSGPRVQTPPTSLPRHLRAGGFFAHVDTDD